MKPVRFVHAADLHLGAPFKGVDASDPRVRDALVASLGEALDRIVSLCVDEKADFLVLSGDVYNQHDKSAAARARFRHATTRLAEAGTPVFIARGNHDPADAWTAGSTLPDNVRYFSHTEVEAVRFERDGELLCTLYGRSYAKAAEKSDLAAGFTRGKGDGIAIGVLHTDVGGREGYLDYAPTSMETLKAAGMDYWALGHIHKREVLLEKSPAVVYAGSPQGLNPKETDLHGCYLVEIGRSGPKIEFRPTCSILWSRASVDVSACPGVDDVAGKLREACAAARADAAGLPTIVRLEISGRSESHGQLVAGTAMAEILCELREEQLLNDPWIWVDRISDHTSASLDIEALRGSEDFGGDLVRLADELAADEAGLAALLADATRQVRSAVGGVEFDLTPEEMLLKARDICVGLLEDGGA